MEVQPGTKIGKSRMSLRRNTPSTRTGAGFFLATVPLESRDPLLSLDPLLLSASGASELAAFGDAASAAFDEVAVTAPDILSRAGAPLATLIQERERLRIIFFCLLRR